MMINTIQQDNQHLIKLRYRNSEDKRVEETFDCRPYFYLPIHTKVGNSLIVKGRRVPLVRTPTKRRNLEGTPLVKFYYDNPYDRYNIMQEIHKTERTYQGDVDAPRS